MKNEKLLKTSSTPLLQQQDALESYFNALLSEIDGVVPDPGKLRGDVAESLAGSNDRSTETLAELPIEPSIEITARDSDKLSVETSSTHATDINDLVETEDTISSAESLFQALDKNESSIVSEIDIIPEWADSLFQVISFSVGESLCAVSIDRIAGIIPTPTTLTYLPGQAPWFMGLHQNKGCTVSVIDLAFIIGQTEDKLEIKSGAILPKGFIVLIGDARWGFVIRDMGNMFMMENDEVQWKHPRDSSEIVVGTVVKNMSTLLDLNIVLKFCRNMI